MSEENEFAKQWARDMAREEQAVRRQIEIDTAAALAELDAELAAEQELAEPTPREDDEGYVSRDQFVPQQLEGKYISRDSSGRPELQFTLTGDRLSIRSPFGGGAYINPRGVGLRRIGLYSCHVRGTKFFADAYSAADLRPGKWVRLEREHDNTHDPNATAIFAPRGRDMIGYVQRGRTAAIARRLEAGEDICGISLRGPGRGSVESATWLILGPRIDLKHMLAGRD